MNNTTIASRRKGYQRRRQQGRISRRRLDALHRWLDDAAFDSETYADALAEAERWLDAARQGTDPVERSSSQKANNEEAVSSPSEMLDQLASVGDRQERRPNEGNVREWNPQGCSLRNVRFPPWTLAQQVHNNIKHRFGREKSFNEKLFLDAYAEAKIAIQVDGSHRVAARCAAERVLGIDEARCALDRPRPLSWTAGRPRQKSEIDICGKRYVTSDGFPTPYKGAVRATIAALPKIIDIGDIVGPLGVNLRSSSLAHHADPMRPPLGALALVAKFIGPNAPNVVGAELGHSAAAQALSLMLPTANVWVPSQVFSPFHPKHLIPHPVDAVLMNIPSTLALALVEDLLGDDQITPRQVRRWSFHLVHRAARNRARTDEGRYLSNIFRSAVSHLGPGCLLVILGDDISGVTHVVNDKLRGDERFVPFVHQGRDLVERPVWAPVPDKPPWSPITNLPPTGRVVSAWRCS